MNSKVKRVDMNSIFN